MGEALIFGYVTAVGFVLAGTLSSFVQLVSGQPMRFYVEHRTFSMAVGSVLLRVFAGPEILVRNAWLGMVKEKRSPSWFWLAAAVAAFWSLIIGCVSIAVVLAL